MAKLGLVTVLFNSNTVLPDFFESISIQSFKNYVLYIIDNTPSQQTDDLITELNSRLPLAEYVHIKNPENYGVAKANNQGIKLALEQGADFVLLLNNDITVFQPFLLSKMVEKSLKSGEDIVVPKILYYGTRKIWVAGGKWVHYKGVSKAVGMGEEDEGQYDRPRYIDYAPTCFMLLRKHVFDSTGLMDEQYFVYYDDDDFVLRATRKGFKIFFMPAVEVYHKISTSTGGSESLFSIYYLNRNRIYFIRKHYKFPLRQIALTYMLVTKGIRYFLYDTERKRQLLNSIVSGFKMKVFSA